MPQPEMVPRPVTTTRCFVAEREVAVRVVVGVRGRRVKAATPVVVQRRKFRGAESLMIVSIWFGRLNRNDGERSCCDSSRYLVCIVRWPMRNKVGT